MATVNYSCTEARYRQNGGSWWSPLSGGITPTGWNSDGSNKYETRYAFDFDAIRAKNVTDSMVSAKLYFRQTNEYNQETVYSRVTTSAYADIAAGSTGTSVVNGWAYITLSSAMCAALIHATAVYVGTYGAANGTYIEIYGTGTYAVYLAIEWTPRAPSPTVSTLDSISTVTTDSKTFNWSDASDTSNIFTPAQLMYEMQYSPTGTDPWGSTYTTAAGVSQYALNLRTALSLLAGQYYYNPNGKIRVRTKTPSYGGTTYYSAYATSAAFAIDYRIAPSVPASLTPSNAAPYEGEAITVTVGRPTTYNAYDGAGSTNVLAYRVAQPGDVLDLESFPVTTASAVLNYTVENLTTGKDDLSTYIYAYALDTESQSSPNTELQAWTVKRFRAPSVIVTTIDREETSATVNVLVTDTGYGGVQANTQITKIEYNLAGGGWTEATLSGWTDLYNSFDVTGLDAATRYTLQVRATNDAPADTALTDKTGSAYTGTILERIPASAPFKDSVTGVAGHFAKTLRVGADPQTAAYIEDFTGWTNPNHTWTYASATTFTVTGNVTAMYYAGVKIRYKQGGAYEYAHVLSSSYSAPNTTVTLVANADFALANDTITDNYFSLADNPAGFPAAFNWSPTFGGFSADPVGIFRFTVNGTKCPLYFEMSTAGTSNANSFTMSIPIAASASTSKVAVAVPAVDNGTRLTTFSLALIQPSGTTIAFGKDAAGNVWTTSGAKRIVYGEICYEI
jgi:hypothetical protein